VETIQKNMLRGEKMKGSLGDISFESAQKSYKEMMRRHILIE
jgi:hypothetical protein